MSGKAKYWTAQGIVTGWFVWFAVLMAMPTIMIVAAVASMVVIGKLLEGETE